MRHWSRGRIKDQITLMFWKFVLINKSSSFATTLILLTDNLPKSFPPQCMRMKLGTGPTFLSDLIFCVVLPNCRPLYPCHHREMFCLSSVKFVPPGLNTASKNACLIIEEPTNHIVCVSKRKLKLWYANVRFIRSRFPTPRSLDIIR